MSDKFKPPRKTLPRRSLLPEPSGESSKDDEANKVERKVPCKALRMRARPFDEDDSTESEATDSDATSPEELEESPKNKNDAINEPPIKKRRLQRRKMKTPRRIISPETEVNHTDATPCNSGESEKAHSDQRVAPEEP